MKETETLQRVDIVSLECRIWSGRKRLRPSDLKLGDGGKLPPEQVASLGSKRIINPDDLAVFHKLKKRAERLCEATGIRFLGGFAIPSDQTAKVRKTLDAIAEEFGTERDRFLDRYDNAVESWIAQYPDFEAALRAALTPRKEVADRLGFDYTPYRVEPSADHAEALEKQTARMGSQLLHEVSLHARKLYEKSFMGTAALERSVPRAVLATFRRMKTKLAGLAFLDPVIRPMVQALDEFFARVPKEGNLKGPLYHEALGLVLILSDPDKVRAHATGAVTVATEGDLPDEDDATDDASEDEEFSSIPTQPLVESDSLYF